MNAAAFDLSRLARANLNAFALLAPDTLTLLENLFLTGAHMLGLAALSRYFHLPPLPALLLVLAPIALQLGLGRVFRLPAVWLAPLFFVYFLLVDRFVFIRLLHGTVSGYFSYAPPDWNLFLLPVEASTLAAGIYSTLILAAMLLRSRRRLALALAGGLFSLALAWASAQYFGHRSYGTTASDPYSYAQMGIDLAEHGTPVHRFELFPEIAPLKIAWYPVVHVGYHLPMNTAGDAVTVWPAGGALAFAAAYRLFGDAGLYWVNPFLTLLSALLAGLLAWELTRAEPAAARALIAVTTLALVATANEQVVWASVTMVDAQAEFFSTAALYCALRARRGSNPIWSLLSGIALAAAYWVRHTQLVLAVAVLVVLWWGIDPPRARARALLLAAGAALLVALPDLWYHQLYLGGWLNPESAELGLFSISALSDTASLLAQALSAANEFGWFWPFAAWGALRLFRRARLEFWALAAWIGLCLAAQLPYAALRLRDVLAEYPALAFVAAYGAVTVCALLLSRRRLVMRLAAGLTLWVALDFFLLRVSDTVPQVWQPTRPIFGYVTERQRAALEELAVLTPATALVGSTLNDGAVELYAQRLTFRPDGWNGVELREFLRVTATRHPDVYLLEDGGAMDGVLSDLRRDFSVERVATLDVPLFGEGPIEQPGALWKIKGQ